MQRAVTGFSLDEANHWVAGLECGHGIHVRHDPPWMVREWVLTEDGRASRVGRRMECKRCDDVSAPQVTAHQP
jgi:hypothetical protein